MVKNSPFIKICVVDVRKATYNEDYDRSHKKSNFIRVNWFLAELFIASKKQSATETKGHESLS